MNERLKAIKLNSIDKTIAAKRRTLEIRREWIKADPKNEKMGKVIIRRIVAELVSLKRRRDAIENS